MAEHNELGNFGEYHVWKMLSSVGKVETEAKADLCFYGVQVEVKTSRPTLYNGKTRGYQFLLSKRGHTDHTKAHVVILVCVGDRGDVAGVFVVPVDHLRKDRQKITIPLSLETRLSPYRDNWQVIADYVGVAA